MDGYVQDWSIRFLGTQDVDQFLLKSQKSSGCDVFQGPVWLAVTCLEGNISLHQCLVAIYTWSFNLQVRSINGVPFKTLLTPVVVLLSRARNRNRNRNRNVLRRNEA